VVAVVETQADDLPRVRDRRTEPDVGSPLGGACGLEFGGSRGGTVAQRIPPARFERENGAGRSQIGRLGAPAGILRGPLSVDDQFAHEDSRAQPAVCAVAD
jgi:hypothetical protein